MLANAPRTLALPAVGLGAAGGAGNNPRSAEAAAQAFESQTLAMLLQPAFAAADVSRSAFGGGAAEEQWQPMLVDAIAGAATRAGGVGIGAMVLREMLRWQAGDAPEGAAALAAQDGAVQGGPVQGGPVQGGAP